VKAPDEFIPKGKTAMRQVSAQECVRRGAGACRPVPTPSQTPAGGEDPQTLTQSSSPHPFGWGGVVPVCDGDNARLGTRAPCPMSALLALDVHYP